MSAGAPKGNNNAAKAKVWTAAIERALEARSKLEGKKLMDEAAQALVDKAIDGDVSALRELGDRLEGKPGQSMTLSGDENNPVRYSVIEIKAVDP